MFSALEVLSRGLSASRTRVNVLSSNLAPTSQEGSRRHGGHDPSLPRNP